MVFQQTEDAAENRLVIPAHDVVKGAVIALTEAFEQKFVGGKVGGAHSENSIAPLAKKFPRILAAPFLRVRKRSAYVCASRRCIMTAQM
jgi:hypothetical protein